LDDSYKGAYLTAIFAIVDWSTGRKYIGPFEEVFEVESHR